MSRTPPSLPGERPPAGLPHPVSTHSFWHCKPSPLLTAHRTTRDIPSCVDVAVIGSGITGASAAWHLLKRQSSERDSKDATKKSLNVVMLEAREACWGATGRNGGHCQPLLSEHPQDPSIGHFELANFSALQALIESEAIDCEFVPQQGVRAIYDSRHLADVELALHVIQESSPDLARHMRVVTSKAELTDLRIPTAMGALITNIAARMWPYKFVSHILEDLLKDQNLKGTFNLQTLTPATSLKKHPRREGNWLISTPRGNITASKVIIATNAYTSHLLPSLAPLIVPVRGQMSALIPLPSVDGDEERLKTSFGFMGEGVDDYLIQRPTLKGGHLMFGGGRQFGLSVGITDDSVIDDDTAKYLRTRLVGALGLPEGKADDRARHTADGTAFLRKTGQASQNPGRRTVSSCCDPSKKYDVTEQSGIDRINERLEFLKSTWENCTSKALHDYQFQLCLLEQQNLQRLTLARRKQELQGEPKQQQESDEGLPPMASDSDEFMLEPHADNLPYTATSEGQQQCRQQELDREVSQNFVWSEMDQSNWDTSSLVPNADLCDTGMSLGNSEQNAKRGRRRPRLRHINEPSKTDSDSGRKSAKLLDFEHQLTLLEQANKLKETMAKARTEIFPPKETRQQPAAREPLAEENFEQIEAGFAPKVELSLKGSHALQDYQMQLMLLEQQNKKRLLMARQEQKNLFGIPDAPQESQMQAMVSGQQKQVADAESHDSPQPVAKASVALPTRSKAPRAAQTVKLSPTTPIEFHATHEWTGIMGFSRDDLPWVGPAPSAEHAGIYISAGYTGHGMPNAWLCGAAVSSMVRHVLTHEPAETPWECECSRRHGSRCGYRCVRLQDQYAVAKDAVGLPEAYLITEQRVERAMQMEDVGARDWAEMERARRKRAGRPLSGYA